MTWLEGRGLSKAYGQTQAVRQVDISVRRGVIVGLVGPNGAGKSTVFKLLAGLEVPDSGSVRFRGEDITRLPLYRRARMGIAYLPQHPCVLPRLTVAENIQIAVRAGPGRPSVEALLEEAGLESMHDRPAGHLSGGERRRLEMVRALAMGPSLLILDEPFSGVDPAQVSDLQVRIRAISLTGVGVLLTDHAAHAALSICDEVSLLDEGIVQVSGTSRAVASDPIARDRYLGHDFCLETHLQNGVVAYNE